MPDPINDSWIYATIFIVNQWNKGGSGFLVARETKKGKGLIFLVTNKHIIHTDDQTRQSATHVKLNFNIKNNDGPVSGHSENFPLIQGGCQKNWHEHPDRNVDVLAINVTPLLNQYPLMERRWSTYSHFIDQEKMDKWDIKIGDEILVIGYPLGITQGDNNFPLIRSGIISSRIGTTIEDYCQFPNQQPTRRIIRGFLTDRAAFPGSSGSPVVLKPTTNRFIKGVMQPKLPPAMLLGIISQTKYKPVIKSTGEIISYEGLGIAFDAKTIKETIELFFQ